MIYMLRHGQTKWNLEKRFNGMTDISLNDCGKKQAINQAKKLNGIDIEFCFSSPLRRAKEASEIICQGLIIEDSRLSEIDCGDFEGKEETKESLNRFWTASKLGLDGVEKFTDFLIRNIKFSQMIEEKYSGKNILIVTHAANARAINYYFRGQKKDYDFFRAVAAKGEIIKYDNNC